MEEPANFVLRLVEEISGGRRVSPDTLLWQDLHLGGDDVVELLERIHQKFGTSFEGLVYSRFFPEEHEAIGASWAARLGLGSKREHVRVQHLVDVVARGQWFDPPDA
jgi:hypothetical protein